ncbi:MAG: hypothetical protein ACJA2C_000296 [Marinoscillum sp.]|jgi:hypothetical protein
MSVEIKELHTKKELKSFVRFQWGLYKGVDPFVPPILELEMSTLSSDKNPGFEHNKARFWLAYQNGKAVGRIAGILHGEESIKEKKIRFGWIDFIDDLEVSSALIEVVNDWGKEVGLTTIHGPMGFTDLDFEGVLISGFNQISTQATLYNYPYYQTHFEKIGFTKAVDWVETRIKVPLGIGGQLERSAQLVEKRYGFHSITFKSGKEILKYADSVFKLLNDSYSHLYGYYPLSENQIKYFIEAYFGFVQKDMVALVVDDQDEVIGFAITFPSLSKAFKKAGGHMYPFGFLHVLKAFYFNDTLDFFLVAAKKELHKKGLHALLWNSIYKALMKHNIKYIFSGQMLEDNLNVNNLLTKYESAMDEEIRRRCFTRSIN